MHRRGSAVNRAELVDTWLREERQPFAGWDFSYLDGRLTGEREHWSYLDRAAELMRGSSSVIDMDTGGGEKLLTARTLAREGRRHGGLSPEFRIGERAPIESGR